MVDAGRAVKLSANNHQAGEQHQVGVFDQRWYRANSCLAASWARGSKSSARSMATTAARRGTLLGIRSVTLNLDTSSPIRSLARYRELVRAVNEAPPSAQETLALVADV